MASPDTALRRADSAGLSALWPRAVPTLTVTAIEPMQVLPLRDAPGDGQAALTRVLAALGLPALPQPGQASGRGPGLICQRTSETMLLTSDGRLTAALLDARRPLAGARAWALDLSAGTLVVELHGSALDALFSRLLDADALPRTQGQASRMRLADIAVTVWRKAPDCAQLLCDRAHSHYLARWLNYAARAL